MKKIIAVTFVAITGAIVFYSCTKNTKEAPTEEQAVAALVASDQFIDFSKRFVADFAALMQYHRSPQLMQNKTAFIAQAREAGTDLSKLPAIYQNAGLDFDQALALRNRIDNDVLSVFNQHPQLLRFNEEQQQRIILRAMDEGLHSSDPKWVEAKSQLALQLNAQTQQLPRSMDGIRARTDIKAVSLSVDEVWGCLKSAVGFGTAGILGVSALAKLAQEGVQAAVISVSKWIAARAGWFGIAIAAIDFGICVYHEAND